MYRLSNTILLILLTVCIITTATYSICLSADHLKYPGNGIPIFSKPKPIKELNKEIEHQAESYPGITFSRGRMSFSNVSGFDFTSSKSLIGPTYSLRVPISIEKGSCTIKIGDVSYLINHEGFSVTEKGKVVFESKKERPIDIIAEVCFASSSTRFHSKERLMEIVHVSFSEPAVINISLNDKCSGWIGPWEWLRGYE